MTENYCIIGLPDNEISEKYMKITIPEIKRVCLSDPILWKGITPQTLKYHNELNFGHVKSTIGTPYEREFYPVEKSIWYSHYTLWKEIKISNTPSWIFEHDVNLSHVDVLISPSTDICTTRVAGNLACYYLTSYGASVLSDFATKEIIHYQVDGFLYALMLYRESVRKMSSIQKINVSQLTMFGSSKEHFNL